MKIKVTDVFSEKGTLRVKFNSPFGNATALWGGITLKIGETLDVELELDEIFSWGQNIMPSSGITPEITSSFVYMYDFNFLSLGRRGRICLIK
jgi:hypothetical protein